MSTPILVKKLRLRTSQQAQPKTEDGAAAVPGQIAAAPAISVLPKKPSLSHSLRIKPRPSRSPSLSPSPNPSPRPSPSPSPSPNLCLTQDSRNATPRSSDRDSSDVLAGFPFDLDAFRRSPIELLSSLEHPRAIELIRRLNEAYFAGVPLVSDAIFDDLLQVSGIAQPPAESSGMAVAVPLPVPMPSLDKVRTRAQIEGFSRKFPGPYLVSDKEDGISVLFHGGRLYTKRTDGVRGTDISHVLAWLKLPKLPEKLAIRGELILRRDDFAKYFPLAKNARNTVAGLAHRSGNAADERQLRLLHLVAYELIVPGIEPDQLMGCTPSEQLRILRQLGFETVPSIVLETIDEGRLTELLLARKKDSPYDIDGLVLTPDRPCRCSGSGPDSRTENEFETRTAKPPEHVIAFKSAASQTVLQTVVREVEWNVSVHGLLKPRLCYDPVFGDGATLSHCTGFNAATVVEKGLGPGAVITVFRKDDVNPQLVSVIHPVEPQLPSVPYVWNATHMDLVLADAVDSEEMQRRRLLHFWTVTETLGLGKETVARCFANGMVEVADFIRAAPGDFAEAGLGAKTSEKVYRAVQETVQKYATVSITGMAKLMHASVCFGFGLGPKKLEEILSYLPDFRTTEKLRYKLLRVPGISDKTADRFVAGVPMFEQFLKATGIRADWQFETDPIGSKPTGEAAAGVRAVFTGFRDAALKELLELHGGRLDDRVNHQTTVLVYKKAGTETKKVSDAKDRGLKTMSADEFRQFISGLIAKN
ncbi:MAG: BRCT domain-containing protein [Sulfobacillus sp.]